MNTSTVNFNRQRGFTLVEIAIVLVIIGLLLGGILKGQELITSARVRNLGDQNAGVQAAYYGFIDRYRRIPGDMGKDDACDMIGDVVPGCPGSGVGGNGDGQFTETAPNWGEASAMWAHLSAARFISGSYQGKATGDANYTANTVAPVNAFNGRLLLSRTGDYEGAPATLRLNLAMGNNIPVNVARELDAKLDDGLPNTGIVRAAKTSADYSIVAQGAAECVKDNIWDMNQDSQDCNVVILY